MVILNLTDKKFNYEFEKLSRLFYPFDKIAVVNSGEPSESEAVCAEEENKDGIILLVKVNINGKKITKKANVQKETSSRERERQLSALLYKALFEVTGFAPPWGILTGVRPARLYLATVNEMGEERAADYFREKLLVSEEKIRLCKAVAKTEDDIINSSNEKDFSLYVSIPFCPSRCSYCSFVSHSVESALKLIPDYLDCLCREIEITAKAAKDIGANLKTVYIGGGTPTTLTAAELELVLGCVCKHFDVKKAAEFTVEAGRPDTIDVDKLSVLKKYGVTRISVNPQTMCDKVLKAVGRRHTAAEFKKAFMLARSTGFNNINCDLIAGLPFDDINGFNYTLEEITKLDPESITVHSLAMKRASNINRQGERPHEFNSTFAQVAVSRAEEHFTEKGYLPYYTYRQSKTVGNLENTGYAKPGFFGLYNVFIMDETHTILAVGASSVTKLRQGGSIKRIFNYKYPYEYISRFNEQMERKDEIKRFYEQNA